MSSLRVISNSITGTHPDPLRHRAILFDLLTKNAFELETLNSSLRRDNISYEYERCRPENDDNIAHTRCIRRSNRRDAPVGSWGMRRLADILIFKTSTYHLID